jgi:hypothetical protein
MNSIQIEQLRNAVACIAELKPTTPQPPPPASASFASLIPQIRKALLSDFQVNTGRYLELRNALVTSGVPVPTLSVCGRGTREIRYTQLMRHFLDPSEPHGLSSKLLVAMMGPELGDTELTVSSLPWDDATVNAEFSLGRIKAGNRMVGSVVDLFLRIGDLTILIENKIGSPEAGATGRGEVTQLRRYSEAFSKHFPKLSKGHVLKLFLTPEGRAPKEDSDWLALSHGVLLKRLAQVLEDGSLSRIARHNLAAFMWDLVCGPLAFGGPERDELVSKLSNALENPDKSIPLQAWCARNVPHLEIMMKTLEVCNE